MSSGPIAHDPQLGPIALEDLVAAFAAGTLPKAEWTHLAHLRVGAWHVARFGVVGALDRLRVGIRAINDWHGVPNNDASGYHETITRAHVLLLDAFLRERSGAPLAAAIGDLPASPLARKNVLLDFYTRERLMSLRARAEWMEPDRRPLNSP